MQVMCIKNGTWYIHGNGAHNHGPQYGEVCTVIETKPEYYHLKEHAFSPISGGKEWWHVDGFVLLSDIDEKNIIAERQKEKA